MNSSNPKKNPEALYKFLTPLEILEFDYFATLGYGKICAELENNGTLIGPLDTLIAAHGSQKTTSVTNSEK